jgi:hypothetical protein
LKHYLPHQYCLRMDHHLVMLHMVANLMIAVAYVLIPACILLAAIRIAEDEGARNDVLKHGKLLAGLFATFILACGGSHLLEVFVLYVPAYWLQGGWALFTGIVSISTAIVLLVLGSRGNQS